MMQAILIEAASLVLDALAGVDWAKLVGPQWVGIVQAIFTLLRTVLSFVSNPAAAVLKAA